MTDYKWLFLDLNSYFASVEQAEHPELMGKPVAVVPMETDYTCAIAASYEAKAYGIKTGTQIAEAKRLCPHLICVLARHNVYVDYHERILDEVIKHIPINTVWSIDELSSRLPERFRSEDAARQLTYQIKDGLRKTISPAIRCSVGIAPNGFLAKVATDMQKPDGLVFLTHDKLPGPLLDLNLTDFPGINTGMLARLKRGNIHTTEQLWNTSPKQARRIWGSVQGERFWYNLHGYEVPEQETQTSMIGHSRILDPDLRAPDKAFGVARRLTIKTATRLRRKNFYACVFTLSVRTMHGIRWRKSLDISPSHDNFTFLHALDNLWSIMIKTVSPAPYGEHRLKKLSITMNNLSRQNDITPDLFEMASITHQKNNQKHTNLSLALDKLNQKYGAETVNIGVSPKTKAGFVGTKIAFSRIPDKAEFYE